jgi:hypothetical protein
MDIAILTLNLNEIGALIAAQGQHFKHRPPFRVYPLNGMAL